MSYEKIVRNHLPKRNILSGEIDDLLNSIENYETLDSYCYYKIDSQLEVLLDDLKKIYWEFKSAVVDKVFQGNKEFVYDLEQVKNFHLIKYKRLQKVRFKISLKKETEPIHLAEAGGGGAVGGIDMSSLGNMLSDALDRLDNTVKDNAKDLKKSKEIL